MIQFGTTAQLSDRQRRAIFLTAVYNLTVTAEALGDFPAIHQLVGYMVAADQLDRLGALRDMCREWVQAEIAAGEERAAMQMPTSGEGKVN